MKTKILIAVMFIVMLISIVHAESWDYGTGETWNYGSGESWNYGNSNNGYSSSNSNYNSGSSYNSYPQYYSSYWNPYSSYYSSNYWGMPWYYGYSEYYPSSYYYSYSDRNSYYGIGYYSYSDYSEYTPPNTLIYGGPNNYYIDPIPPSSVQTPTCNDPSGVQGDRTIMGIETRVEFECSDGQWIFVRQVTETSQPTTVAKKSKLEFYGGVREPEPAPRTTQTTQQPATYARPPQQQPSEGTYCVEPAGYEGDIRIFGISNKAEYKCIRGIWVFQRNI